MFKYTLEDTNNRVKIADIDLIEYEAIEKFYPNYEWFESVMGSLKNYKFSFKSYNSFYQKTITSEFGEDLQFVHDHGVYLLTGCIIFSRTFIDNIKNFSRLTDLKSINEMVKKISSEHEMMLIKALRDYCTHFALPIKNTSRVYDAINGKTTVQFYIYKADLLKNTKNQTNTKTISDHENTKIIVSDLLVQNDKNIEKIATIVLEEFVKGIPKETKNVFREHIKYYRSKNGEMFFPNAFVRNKENEGYYFSENYLGMDRNLLEMIVSMI